MTAPDEPSYSTRHSMPGVVLRMITATAHCPQSLRASPSSSEDLVERVGTSTPVRQEKRQADGLEETCNGTYGNGVKWALFSDNLSDNLISQSN
jgi:hypothetical protein